MRYLKGMSLILAAGLLFTGCAKQSFCTSKIVNHPYDYKKVEEHPNIEKIAHYLSQQLFMEYKKLCPKKHLPIVMTSFVNLHKFKETSNLGRLLSEIMLSDFSKHHIPVYDYRLQNAITISESGEFILNRDYAKLKQTEARGYVMVGTYAISEGSVIFNARLINMKNLKVMASAYASINDPSLIAELCQNGLCNLLQNDTPVVIPIEKEENQ